MASLYELLMESPDFLTRAMYGGWVNPKVSALTLENNDTPDPGILISLLGGYRMRVEPKGPAGETLTLSWDDDAGPPVYGHDITGIEFTEEGGKAALILTLGHYQVTAEVATTDGDDILVDWYASENETGLWAACLPRVKGNEFLDPSVELFSPPQ